MSQDQDVVLTISLGRFWVWVIGALVLAGLLLDRASSWLIGRVARLEVVK